MFVNQTFSRYDSEDGQENCYRVDQYGHLVKGWYKVKEDYDENVYWYYYDDNGVAVEMEDQRLYGSENRLWVSYDQIPKHLCDAYIAIEDKRFESHHGVDWITTLKATFGFLTNTDSAGGSTITQQLIKNLTGDDEVRIQRKVQEIFRALNLEKQYSKEQILEMYLNTV